jgi:hypothetical protein
MTMRSQNKDSLSLNLSVSGNSPDANPVGYNGSPLAVFRMGVGASIRGIARSNDQKTLAIAAVLLALAVTGCISPPATTTPSTAPSTPPSPRCSDPAAPKAGCRWQGKDSQAGCGKRLICALPGGVVNS